MDTDTGTLFLALLGLGSQASIAALALVPQARALVRRDALTLAFLVALVATGGSLWLSEGAGFVPCKLCWYQRIAMYPLTVVLGVAALRRDVAVRAYALPVAAFGATISVWHMLIERFPSLSSSTSCELANPCSIIWTEHFGYMTIPTMALTGFVLIGTLVVLARPEGA